MQIDEGVIEPGILAIRTRFDDYIGLFVMHCHRLNHEDNGLMMLINVIPAISSYAVAVPGAPGKAAEVRVRFSEPMVPIGRLPDQVAAPFFSIRPAVTGTFRWAGPTLLVFTPDAKTPLLRATRYDVTIASNTTAVSGRTLGGPFSFSFTTPTVRLLQTHWYRLNGRFDQPVVIPLRFNQPVDPPTSRRT